MKYKVLSPVMTPFNEEMTPDSSRFVRHCRWLLNQDVGLAIFGTNSEANSLSIEEKCQLLETLIEEGVEPEHIMPGTGSCAVPDAVAMTRHAVSLGCEGVLMLPPFYYKSPSNEGLYRYYAEIIESVGDTRLKIYLYHIPAVATVALNVELIERLLKAFPGTIAGIKDSGGDWGHTHHLIDTFADEGFKVFAGSEPFLLDVLRAGGAGCISATANVNPAAISQLAKQWDSPDADRAQQDLIDRRRIFERYPMIPAMKAATSHYLKDEAWSQVRPPLVELDEQERRALTALLDASGFAMSGYP